MLPQGGNVTPCICSYLPFAPGIFGPLVLQSRIASKLESGVHFWARFWRRDQHSQRIHADTFASPGDLPCGSPYCARRRSLAKFPALIQPTF
jgi:hypothetical protein